MKSVDRPLRVFLCHSSNDKPAVRELYQKLRAETWIQPWLDEEELYPGQDWNMEIEKAVEAADAIIVCLTKGSITKEGYVQRELRIVLDFADYKPEGTLYIIPVRLEECEPPRRLRAWQYADYFEGQRERAFQRLCVSLKRRATSLELEYEEKNKQKAKEETDRLAEQKAEEERTALAKIEFERKAKEEIDRLAEQKVEEERIAQAKIESERKAKEERIVKEKRLADEKAEAKRKAAASQKEWFEKTWQEAEQKYSKEPEKIAPTQIVMNKTDENVNRIANLVYKNKLVFSNGMEFMKVPAGRFLMGSKNDDQIAFDDEKPQHVVDIPYDYWMARSPATNRQYDLFAKAKEINHPVLGWENKKDHPVVNVSWNTIIEYCQWLNNLLKTELPSGLVLRLPTESEWEKAARGKDGLKYPWGNEFNKNNCNSNEGGKGDTTPIDLYSPQGDSPYGCTDMSGNVWEWTHTEYRIFPYDAKDNRENEHMNVARVLRGGSFSNKEGNLHCALRFKYYQDRKQRSYGFRIALAPPLSK